MATGPFRLAQPVPAARRLDCRRAGICLGIACRAGWPGFGCGDGGCYEEPSQIERRADLEALSALVRAIATPHGTVGAAVVELEKGG